MKSKIKSLIDQQLQPMNQAIASAPLLRALHARFPHAGGLPFWNQGGSC